MEEESRLEGPGRPSATPEKLPTEDVAVEEISDSQEKLNTFNWPHPTHPRLQDVQLQNHLNGSSLRRRLLRLPCLCRPSQRSVFVS